MLKISPFFATYALFVLIGLLLSEISKIPPEIAKICSSVNLAVIPSIVISITGALTSFLQSLFAIFVE